MNKKEADRFIVRMFFEYYDKSFDKNITEMADQIMYELKLLSRVK